MSFTKEDLLDIFKGEFNDILEDIDDLTKETFIASNLLGLDTYDPVLDEIFTKDILEVFKVIKNRENFEYIKDEANYLKFITVVNLVGVGLLDWGCSIRGAWFGECYDSCNFTLSHYFNYKDVGVVVLDNASMFVDALIEFYEEK